MRIGLISSGKNFGPDNKDSRCLMNKITIFLFLLSIAFLTACSSPEEKAARFVEQADKLLEDGKIEKAAIEYKNALQIKPELVDAWYGLVLVMEKQSKWKEMFKFLEKVLNLDAKHVPAMLKQGKVYLAAGNLDKAVSASDQSFALAPDDVDVLTFRAATMLKLDDPAQAVEFANKALAIEPENANALIILASEKINAGDPQAALVFLEKGISIEEKNLALQLLKIQVLGRLSDFNATEAALKRLIVLFPDAREFNHALARFYMMRDRTPDAEKVFRDLALDKPDDIEAQLDLVRFMNTVHGKEAGLAQLKKLVNSKPDNQEIKFSLVALYRETGNEAEAKSLLQGIVDSNAEVDVVNRAKGLLASLEMAEGNLEKTNALIEEILRVDSSNEQALVLKSSMQIDERKLDQAIANLRTVLRDTPDSARAHLLLGRAHEFKGSVELAEDHYARAFAASKHSTAFGMPYVRFLLKKKNTGLAERTLNQILRANPSDVTATKALAQLYLAQGKYAEAQRLSSRLQSMDIKDGSVEQILGTILARNNEVDKSIEAFKLAHESAPEAGRPMAALVSTYVKSGEIDKAREFLDSVLQSSPGNINALMLKGQLFLIDNNKPEAIKAFQEIIAVSPDLPVGYRMLSGIYNRDGDFDKSLALLEQGIEKTDSFELHMIKAGVFEAQGNFDAAIGVYEQLIEKNPNANVAANNLASLLSDYRDDADSLHKAYELALRFERSEIPQFLDTLGWIAYKLDKLNVAEVILEKAVKHGPSIPDLRYHLGTVYAAVANTGKAKAEFEKALELAGDGEFIYREQVEEALKRL